MIEDQVMISHATADVRASIGDVVELVELVCPAILSTPSVLSDNYIDQ